jgi:hypothetical protein
MSSTTPTQTIRKTAAFSRLFFHRTSDWRRLKKPYLAGMLLRKNQ